MAAVQNLVQTWIDGLVASFGDQMSQITQYSTPIVGEGYGWGDSVYVPFVSNTSASVDYTPGSTVTTTVGNQIAGKQLTINIYKMQPLKFNDDDFKRVSRAAVEAAGGIAGNRLAADFLSASFASVVGSWTNSFAYGVAGLTGSVGLNTLEKQANDLKWPTNPRTLLMNSTAKYNIISNQDVRYNYAFGRAVQPTAQVDVVYSFTPSLVTHGLGAGVNALAINPQALGFVTTTMKPAERFTAQGYYSQPIFETKSGLTLQFLEGYNWSTRTLERYVEIVGGCGVLDANAAIKIA